MISKFSLLKVNLLQRYILFVINFIFFGFVWEGYAQIPPGWTRTFIDGTNSPKIDNLSNEDIAVQGRNRPYPYNNGFGKHQKVEYTKGPFTQEGWYYFTVGADDGFIISKITSGGETEILRRPTWIPYRGICRSIFVYLSQNETLKVTHINETDPLKSVDHSFHLSNFAKVHTQNIKINAGNCIDDMSMIVDRWCFNVDYHSQHRKESNGECAVENIFQFTPNWIVKKGSDTKKIDAKNLQERLCYKGKDETIIPDSFNQNVFDIIKEAFPTSSYGIFDIQLEYELTNGVDKKPILSNTIKVTIPELKKASKELSVCAETLKNASWDTATNNVKTSADEVEIKKGDLDIVIENELACCPLSWYITQEGNTTELFKGTGQPSTSTQKIKLADSDTQEKKYIITYTLGCSGQTQSRDIIVRPRPTITIIP